MKNIEVNHDRGFVDMALIEIFERKIGYCFPEAYKQLTSQHNNLYPEQDSFNFINIYSEEDEREIAFYGYGEWPIESIEQAQHSDVYSYEGIVTFGRSANGDHVCFDYRHDPKTCEPRVVLMYHDDYVEDANGAHMVVNDVAPTFEAFIDMLYKDEEE